MKKILFLITGGCILMITGCNGGSKDDNANLASLKKKLEAKKKEQSSLESEVRSLEEQIAKLDTSAAELQNRRLVAVSAVASQDFVHYIELQGKVDADNIVVVMPRGMPAQVKGLFVTQGDFVKQGQLLVKLDDAIILQQLDGLNTQLAYAENMYNRQKNLWDQGIGTEVQLITAKNNVDGLNKQIATLKENWKTYSVYAPISGKADVVDIKVGETFTGATATGPQIRIVNTNSMKVVTEVPENYQKGVSTGTTLQVSVPDIGKNFTTKIKATGAIINPNTRAFTTEAKIPSDPALRVNQNAVVRIEDYASKNVIVIPVNIVQSDEKNKYVYVMVKEGDRLVARKKIVETGMSYNSQIEIKSGLNAGDQIITSGYQLVYDGQAVTTE
ncbi:MAG: efflux RND transporter periplasmic adaptor subunit [Bacteroidetes bacterium]|nr:efflux RND transporter periplasmic adaptor subunit [Bacteroidota bacterium]MBS1930964.1 efflux RND transporter periplasmic adaptor subunit [Bacteroidota bacterium]